MAVVRRCELSIIMPCLNESETIETCIKKASQFLSNHRVDGEVIVADNGSIDGSSEIAYRAGAHVVDVQSRGYGSALMGGILAAKGDLIIIGDADDSYDFMDLMPFLHRYLGNPLLSFIGRLFFRSRVGDFHCGLRGFRRDAILRLDLQTTGMEFASEMVVKASLYGLKVFEVPTILYPDGRSRAPHLNTLSDGWRHLRFLLLYSPRWLFLYPGIIAVVVGVAAYIWISPGPRIVGTISLDINTLLYAALLILIGVQAILFAILTKTFGIREGFLPPDPQLDRLIKFASLETGALTGLLLIAGGGLSSVVALYNWESRSFGPLDPSISIRLVIPGVILIAIGFQIILSSFFLGILSMQHK